MRKRHAERCARGLHRRRSRTPANVGTDIVRHSPNIEVQSSIFDVVAPHEPPTDDPTNSNHETTVGHTECTFEDYVLPSIDILPTTPLRELSTAQDGRSETSSTSVRTSANVFPPLHASASAACYFQHFHSFLPIIHSPTFRLSFAPSVLASIVVAIGKVYGHGGCSNDRADLDLWRGGVDELLSLVCHRLACNPYLSLLKRIYCR